MLKRLLLPCLLLYAFSASAQVYKWVDADGVVHYSDQPAPGAERIDLPGRPTAARSPQPARPTPAARPVASTASTSTASTRAAAPFSYVALSVKSPVADETLWNIGGALTANLSLQPGLRSGDRIRMYLDGEPTETQVTLGFQFQEVWRGEHKLQAEVVDANGKVMIRSEPMRFYIQQTSVARP